MNRHNIIGFLSSVLSLSTLVFVIMDGSRLALRSFPGLGIFFRLGFWCLGNSWLSFLNNSYCYCSGSKFRIGA